MNKLTIKNIILANWILATVIFYGCGDKSTVKAERKCFLTVCNGEGWNSGMSTVECDSFQMLGVNKAFVWVDGTKMQIQSDRVIYPNVR